MDLPKNLTITSHMVTNCTHTPWRGQCRPWAKPFRVWMALTSHSPSFAQQWSLMTSDVAGIKDLNLISSTGLSDDDWEQSNRNDETEAAEFTLWSRSERNASKSFHRSFRKGSHYSPLISSCVSVQWRGWPQLFRKLKKKNIVYICVLFHHVHATCVVY